MMIITRLLFVMALLFTNTFGFSASNPDNGINGSQLRCTHIYPSVQKTSISVLSRILSKFYKEQYDSLAINLADSVISMLKNMTANKNDPIHPGAFFSMIKDFESSGDINNWANGNFGFFSPFCTSGLCSGYFQVDVEISSNWDIDGICGKQGLDILEIVGGADYCALFYWMLSSSLNNCSRFKSDINICLADNYQWHVDDFAKGYKIYGQTPQWGEDSWKKMYQGFYQENEFIRGYRSCVIDDHLSVIDIEQGYFDVDPDFDRNYVFNKAVESYIDKIGLTKLIPRK